MEESWAQGAVCRRWSPDVYQAYEERHASNQRRPIEMTGEIQHYITATIRKLGKCHLLVKM